ncbi:MAG: alpha/beta hydrolase [Salinisphaera sp.]|nr:alpha/beta hydrolase [Salinisphaera sp.]
MHSQESILVRGLRYHIHVGGPSSGQPLFLLHGLMDTGASFAPLAEHLPGWRLIAPDWRGHGHSERAPQGYWFPDYVADLDLLVAHYTGDGKAILVGHSMGGQVAALYAGLRSERISRLVLLDSLNLPATPAEDIPRRYRAWLDAQQQRPRPRSYANREQLAGRIRKRYPELAAEQTQKLARAWSQPGADGQVQLVSDPLHRVPFPMGFHPAEAMAVWRRIQAPTLYLEGGDSPGRRWLSGDEMQRRRACFADLQHAILPGCGHMLHLEQPTRVGEHIAAFVQRG